MPCQDGGSEDNDDYFHDADDSFAEAAASICVPDLPEGLNTESDSIDLDDIPCKIPGEQPESGAPAGDGSAAAENATADTARKQGDQMAWPRQEAAADPSASASSDGDHVATAV